MTHDLIVTHVTKRFETGVGKEIGNNQVFGTILFEKILKFLIVRDRMFLTILILRIYDAIVNLNMTFFDLKEGITILVQYTFEWTDEFGPIFYICFW